MTRAGRPRLSVNVDHVATLRQARGAGYPDPVEAALVAEAAGAAGVTVHLRGDRRHIQDEDVARLRRRISGKLNLEMAVTGEMLAIAREIAPDQVTLVPERAEEVTTEGGLDLTAVTDEVADAAAVLNAAGISVSLFLDPDPEQIERLRPTEGSGITAVGGFEINTDRYTRAAGGEAAAELEKIGRVARLGSERGLAVYAGHGLTTDNVGPVAALPEIEELNIGHFIVARAVIVGMTTAVQEMLEAIERG
ncbi:MAG: pyridoxine 5'-phosphate synthase [Thermoanaerobaculia bacterium]|nr:pyridoxine 5'-phosphate synthase [Thermoanaerobaculia bacterium]